MFRQNKQFASVRNLTYNVAFMAALVGYASSAIAQIPGTFTATGNLPIPFPWSGTLLPDGNVLMLIEGDADTGQAAANELYDPGTGTFTATGDRTTYGGYTATLLLNGKVLIAETWARGANGIFSPGHAELYDPDTGTFAPTGEMTVKRAGGTATLLNNGKVLIAGGQVAQGVFEFDSASAELYDPSTGTFAATGDMNEPSCDTATLLPNGKVLITRSFVYDYGLQRLNLVRHAELYDPSTGTFAFTGDMTTDHSGRPTATLLTNGKVLLAGGAIGDCLDDDCLPSALAELYDPATGVFTVTGNMTEARSGHTATLLPDGTVLITGQISALFPDASAEIYDPVKGTFSATASMLVGRYAPTATLLNSGRVLIAGGYNLVSAELYTPAVLVPMPVSPWQQAIAAMKTAAGTGSLNFFQWAWYWQTTPAFVGAPSGFGAGFGSISPDLMEQIIAAGGGNPLLNLSAEQWLLYFRSVVSH